MADTEQTGQAGTQKLDGEKEFSPDVEITQEMFDIIESETGCRSVVPVIARFLNKRESFGDLPTEFALQLWDVVLRRLRELH